jgi:hypothetical protein
VSTASRRWRATYVTESVMQNVSHSITIARSVICERCSVFTDNTRRNSSTENLPRKSIIVCVEVICLYILI